MQQGTYSPGTVIANLRLERILGVGGFGEVWLAEHLDLGDFVAIKIPLVPEYVRVLRLEGRLQHQLEHENIIHVIDLNTTNDPPYCVMEYIDGENLRQLLEREKKLSLNRTRELTHSILLGLHEAHRLGIVHRDIKPENILISKNGTVKIADFGLGSVVNEVTKSIIHSSKASQNNSPSSESSVHDSITLSDDMGSATLSLPRIVGTFDYMSPEQRAGDKIDARSDIYSLAVIIVEMLTGQRPYGDVASRLQRHHIPEEFCKALLTALDERDYRFDNANAFLRALDMDLPNQSFSSLNQAIGDIKGTLQHLENNMVYIEGDVFTMGSDNGPDSERPSHPKQVDPFYLSRYAVTASEFCLFLNHIGGNKSRLIRLGRSCTTEQAGSLYTPAPGCENHPANCVSHTGALMYCDWLNKQLATNYRLPTEAEWEYSVSYQKLILENICYKRHMKNPEDTICSVNSFKANSLGLYQMTGNVAEWCLGPYLGNYSHAQLVDDKEAQKKRLFVVRGGSWSSQIDELVSTRRRVQIGQTFSPTIGFRVARSLGGEV